MLILINIRLFIKNQLEIFIILNTQLLYKLVVINKNLNLL